jgi:hypothetical protein
MDEAVSRWPMEKPELTSSFLLCSLFPSHSLFGWNEIEYLLERWRINFPYQLPLQTFAVETEFVCEYRSL